MLNWKLNLMAYPRISSFKTAAQFADRIAELGIELPFDETIESEPGSTLGTPIEDGVGLIGNRFCILPMEGWDGEEDGRPSELTRRRWEAFGISGAKLIFGGEAVAVRHDGRANPNQLMLNETTVGAIAVLREALEQAHQERFGSTDGLRVGLQLTHSGRFSRPDSGVGLRPRVAYRHPILDNRFNVGDDALFSDDELERLIEDYVKAAVLAQRAGFSFVDIKHCHGYLGHELLSGFDRSGKFGGSFENRTRFLREIANGIRAEAGGLEIAVRYSMFDFVPFKPGENGVGVPVSLDPYRYAFGGDGSGAGINFDEPARFLTLLKSLGVSLVCTTAGSPYYNPHIQRPATFPPSDGYQPPEDPLVGVARQINATAELKKRHPEMIMIGSGYSYLQEWLPNVAQFVVRARMVDLVGLGRMVLSYPDLPADVFAGKPLARKRLCRTFSDCTTAPRNGFVSGCYPLDPFYKKRPERQRLVELKSKQGSSQ